MSDHDRGALAVAIFAEGTADLFTTLTDADNVAELGRCVKRLSLDETLLLTIAASWRAEPAAARAAFKWSERVKGGAEKVSVELLLGKRLPDGKHKGSGLKVALHAAQGWFERFSAGKKRVTFHRRPGPARAGLPPQPLGAVTHRP